MSLKIQFKERRKFIAACVPGNYLKKGFDYSKLISLAQALCNPPKRILLKVGRVSSLW
jgi:hypothetical protein